MLEPLPEPPTPPGEPPEPPLPDPNPPEPPPPPAPPVNAQRGVVQLRGEVPTPELTEHLVERARSVQGVRDVENLLYLPGMPAGMHG